MTEHFEVDVENHSQTVTAQEPPKTREQQIAEDAAARAAPWRGGEPKSPVDLIRERDGSLVARIKRMEEERDDYQMRADIADEAARIMRAQLAEFRAEVRAMRGNA